MDLIEILGKIGFDWRMALANLVNFLIIFWLLKKYAFGPIKKTLVERKKKIDQGLEDSKAAEAQKMMAEQNYGKKMEAARVDADAVVAMAHKQGENLIHKSKQQAEKDIQVMRDRANVDIEKTRQNMKEEVKAEASGLAVSMAEKILREKVGDRENEKIIEKALG